MKCKYPQHIIGAVVYVAIPDHEVALAAEAQRADVAESALRQLREEWREREASWAPELVKARKQDKGIEQLIKVLRRMPPNSPPSPEGSPWTVVREALALAIAAREPPTA